MEKNCIFCQIKENKIYENEHFYALFDIHPVSPGHALVIPKKHTISLLDLDSEQWNSLQDAIKKTISAIESADFKKIYQDMIERKETRNSIYFCKEILQHPSISKKPDGYNIGNNEGSAAGRTIEHLHIQIIPRYKTDSEDQVGGMRTIIPRFGSYQDSL